MRVKSKRKEVLAYNNVIICDDNQRRRVCPGHLNSQDGRHGLYCLLFLSPVNFLAWIIDKGSKIHSHFIVESSDISGSVGYQDTWREAQPSN